ncbi:unnamed protein product [Staurois parvus]|uniref:Uncharacterized protein n=1 Tax=Staurois parvus TaxID=386267 RepID=A0ABN9GM64_9NEOB|nr:unnamed protein product [Staurois parvus]
MGPYTASSCCCQVQSLSWVPVRPPIAAVSIATLCHVPLSGLLTLLVCSIFCHRVLADYGPPIAAARPLICHGPLYRLLMLLPSPESHGSLYASHCCCLHRHTAAMCHFQVSSHCWCVFHFLS